MGDPADLTYRARYWDDTRAKAAFRTFLIAVHNLDLSLWEARGFWDESHYVPFSFFDGDRVVASACLYSMELVIDGRTQRVGQFSGVGTLPEYRRRGLGRALTERALRWASATHDGFFLFADDGAVPFYRRCGFEPLDERVPILACEDLATEPTADAQAAHDLRKLDMGQEQDLALIYALAQERSPVSDILGVRNAKLLMFHALYTLADCAYHIAGLDVVVFFRVADGRLMLFDIVGRRIPTFTDVYPYLAREPHREVRFHFLPDKLGVEVSRYETFKGNLTHLLPPFRLSSPHVLFPYTCHA